MWRMHLIVTCDLLPQLNLLLNVRQEEQSKTMLFVRNTAGGEVALHLVHL